MSHLDDLAEEGHCVLYTGTEPDFGDKDFEVLGSGEEAFSYAQANKMLESWYHWDGFSEESGHPIGGKVGFLKKEEELEESDVSKLNELV